MPAACDSPRHRSEGLVGRVAEQEALAARIDSLDSAGGAVMLVGEAGMGKTALLTHLATIAARHRADRVIWLRGEESEAVLAFAAARGSPAPPAEVLRPLAERQRRALDACLALSGDEPCGPLAVCAGALGVLAAAADQHPLVILVDDFQWIDPESQKILLFIGRRLSAERIVMVMAVRDRPGILVTTGSMPVSS